MLKFAKESYYYDFEEEILVEEGEEEIEEETEGVVEEGEEEEELGEEGEMGEGKRFPWKGIISPQPRNWW